MSTLILGNSHIACIKQACEELPDIGDVFFAGGSAAHGDFFNIVRFDAEKKTIRVRRDAQPMQHKLWKLTTGSTSPLNLSRFRKIYVVGLIKAPNPWSLNNCPASPGTDLDFLDTPPMSFSLYKEIWENLYLRKAIRFAKQLRSVSRAKVMYIPKPLIREDAPAFSAEYEVPKEWSELTDSQKNVVTENERGLYRLLCKGRRLDVFVPDDELVTNGYRCSVKYSQGALSSQNFTPGLNSKYDDAKITIGNLIHKNKAYGRYLLDKVIQPS